MVLTQVEVGTRLLSGCLPQAEEVHAAAAGRYLTALAVTEPSGGLDFDAMTTRVEGSDGLVLSGEKWSCSNAPFADEIVVLARDLRFAEGSPGRHTLVRVPASAPGVRVTPLESFGHYGITGRVELEAVRLGPAVLGSRGSGLLRLMRHWVHERVMLALRAVSMADSLLAGSAPLIAREDPDLLAELSSRAVQERIAVRHALRLLADNDCDPRTAAGCKLRAVDLLRQSAEAALNRSGGPAAERALRDALGLALAGAATRRC
ncbi:hypothetical protein GXW82_08010 [Streptacidiphilus sp. 4-A2]|nr:hypothetical protein [Streptacidiphilus sp. 4-A2]